MLVTRYTNPAVSLFNEFLNNYEKKQEDVEVSVDENVLTIKGKREVKNVVEKVEESVEKGLETVKETFHNVASHLPFANLAKKDSDTFNIESDLPGVKKEDIELKVEDDYLTVTAVRKYKNEVRAEDYYLQESNFGLISRSFVLPDSIDRDSIKAKYEDGRLYLTLEKVASKKAKTISIK